MWTQRGGGQHHFGTAQTFLFLIFPNLHTNIANPKKTQEVAASNHVFITVSSVRQMCQDSSQADSYLRVGEASSGLNVILDCVSDI